MRAVVEEATAPELVVSLWAIMEIEMICSVEPIETIKDIVAGMRMHDV
jgi:hypothetical protein